MFSGNHPGSAYNIRDLRRVILVAEYRSMHRAALQLGLDQTTLSRSVIAVEHAMGIKLFDRSRTGSQVTRDGAEFLSVASGVLAEMDRAAIGLRLRRRGRIGTLRLGVQTSFASGPVADMLDRYEKAYPEVETQITDDTREGLLRELAATRLDAAIVLSRDGVWSNSRALLGHERLMVAMGKSHPLAFRTNLPWPDLSPYVIMIPRKGAGAEILRLVSQHGAETQQLALQDTSIDRLLAMLARRERVSIVTAGAVGMGMEDIVFRPLVSDGEPVLVRHILCWRGEDEDPVVGRFVELAQDYDWDGGSSALSVGL
ncbi:LysR substrate-binding domain-containing protein [Gluconobacter sp.]|uniref:LysR substrate-binding domain-containing protein n=1 Tax=Gluconobacter sp. TaxID=1876758 RepID=UPI0039EC675B